MKNNILHVISPLIKHPSKIVGEQSAKRKSKRIYWSHKLIEKGRTISADWEKQRMPSEKKQDQELLMKEQIYFDVDNSFIFKQGKFLAN